LFRSIKQESEEGTRVAIYDLSFEFVPALINHLNASSTKPNKKPEKDANFLQLLEDLQQVDGDCVVFNFECCSGCSYDSFPLAKANAFEFFAALLEHKYLIMFSDFSLKFLISQWDSSKLGKNPFIRVCEYSSSVKLR